MNASREKKRLAACLITTFVLAGAIFFTTQVLMPKTTTIRARNRSYKKRLRDPLLATGP